MFRARYTIPLLLLVALLIPRQLHYIVFIDLPFALLSILRGWIIGFIVALTCWIYYHRRWFAWLWSEVLDTAQNAEERITDPNEELKRELIELHGKELVDFYLSGGLSLQQIEQIQEPEDVDRFIAENEAHSS